MKEGSEGEGGEKKKDAPSLEGRERARGIKRRFIGSSTTKAKGEDRERPYTFYLKENVSYIRDKGGKRETREGGG